MEHPTEKEGEEKRKTYRKRKRRRTYRKRRRKTC